MTDAQSEYPKLLVTPHFAITLAVWVDELVGARITSRFNKHWHGLEYKGVPRNTWRWRWPWQKTAEEAIVQAIALVREMEALWETYREPFDEEVGEEVGKA